MNPDNGLLAVWAALAVLLGLVVGAMAGLVKWAEARNVPKALLTAGAACGGTITLTVVLINMLTHGSS